MKITITAKNTQLTDSIKNYVEKKIGRLERKLDSPVSAEVVLSVERYRHIADVKLNIDGEIMKATESSKDMYSSVDLVYEVLEKQIEKMKDKLYKSKRRQSSQSEYVSQPTEREPVIVEEEFIPKPMTPEEAILKLNEEDKHFVVFNNSENGKVCVIYKKKNGDYGYIVTR
ncbi:ribosome hibernation-promoting factor, HPF/YfiA family [Hippea jasoniae]|uniref:ribosome hibernation-promoting factor, HPF/YfiA family n=1 Tax=Hippea jasoniae TaxID=944479 RepID=UPI0005540CEC|nr:ribosome-associated translation inhibitor RaiA [Hippea jasoniae]